MLPSYGVLIGRFLGFTTDQGQWFHVDLNIDAGGEEYQAAVDVNEQTLVFQFQVLDHLDANLFAPISALTDGWHQLESNPNSGAMDYARSPILQRPLGCLGILWGVINAVFGTSLQSWTNVTGNEAGDALVAMVTGSTRVFAFGAPYTEGLGVHDVHCNQGDPLNSAFSGLDGIWQDGCVFAIKADGTLSVYLGKFAEQTLNTNSSGQPN
jgi:hypothetical protein